eukprot:gb/GECH01014206.1/.p1 GENE.gb/GECH01014206.1/~~gb/GECH01014206.1/.p1  ORF type:complete len:682 (+),score=155.78 gb/GECH01014206.1/:1-2046(+)
MGVTIGKQQQKPVQTEDIGGGRVNAYLATLPKLFAATTVSGQRFLCTCKVTSSFKSLAFACTDAQEMVFNKYVSQEELKNIREALDVSRNIGWWSFFSALKHSFIDKRVSVQLEKGEGGRYQSCNMIMELNFVTLGRTDLSLRLNRMYNTPTELSATFLYPLYDFYTIRNEMAPADQIDKLERQIKSFTNKANHFEKQLADKHSNGTPKANDKTEENSESEEQENSDKKEISSPDNAAQQRQKEIIRRMSLASNEELLNIPAEDILKFLKQFKRRLSEQEAITDKEKQSFDVLVQTLTLDNLYTPTIEDQSESEFDPQVLKWLKAKFGNTKEKNNVSRDIPFSFKPASEFIRSSSIHKTKTREDIVSMFDKVDQWNFDVFQMENLTEGHTLFITAYTLFVKYDLLNKFSIDETTLTNCLREIEAGYHPNPYHNAMHAADVLQVLHFIIGQGGLADYMTDEDILAALLAAIIHDYDHPGLNNTFQTNAQSYLATLYNDRSILENHHCAQAFELMRNRNFDIFAALNNEQRKSIRETIIQMVLSTDMALHGEILGKFKSRIEGNGEFSSRDDIRLALQIAIKCADVSNPARPRDLYLKWADRICEEFYNQGDKERELALSISPFMDRTKPAFSKGQIAFCHYIVLPLFESFAKLLPKMKFTADHIKQNKKNWKAKPEESKPTE